MPEVNGKRYRTFGQGYNKEKAPAEGTPQMGNPEPDGDEQGDESNREMQIKELGGGKYETKSKHEDGKVTREQHESGEALKDHMDSHFGLEHDDEVPEDEDNESGHAVSEGSSDALHSILQG